jgi:hypothetical protein
LRPKKDAYMCKGYARPVVAAASHAFNACRRYELIV